MKKSRGVLIAALVVILGIGIGAIGYVLGTREDSGDSLSVKDSVTSQSVDTKDDSVLPGQEVHDSTLTTPACPESQFKSLELGIKFCYPASWGESTSGAPQSSQSDKGSGFEVSFSSSSVVVGAISPEYQNTIGRGGRCEDPTYEMLNFALYSTSWVKDSADSELTAAVRYPEKSDGLYLAKEDVNEFFFGLCYSVYVVTKNPTYPVVKAALRKDLGSTSVLEHTQNPLSLLSQAERDEMRGVAESLSYITAQ